MNLQVNTKCFQLSIDSNESCLGESPAQGSGNEVPTGKYSPENTQNPYDEAGQIHNQVIRQLRDVRASKALSNEQILKEATKMVSATKFRSGALQGLGKGDVEAVHKAFLKYGIIDGCIPFPWPWLPGMGPFVDIPPIPMPNPPGTEARISPIDLIIKVAKALWEGKLPIFIKSVITDWENQVMNSRADEKVKEACLINASIVRYSFALAVEANEGNDVVHAKVSPWWSVLADGVGGLVGSLGGGIGTIVGAAAASGVADAAIDKANEK